MKTEATRLFLRLGVLLVAAALQDLWPALCGVKPPFLLAVGLVLCRLKEASRASAWAFAAGAFAAALSALPVLPLALLYLALAWATRYLNRVPLWVLGCFAAAFAEMWACALSGAGPLSVRLFLVTLLGAPLFAGMPLLINRLNRFAGVEDVEGGVS